jgi:riboflavin synthase
MFTGIITHQGSVIEKRHVGEDATFLIRSSQPLIGNCIGASIACSGVCLTVATHTVDTFTVDVSTETLRCTTARQWDSGTTRLNLERALCVGQELGGHLVTGHVDGIATLHCLVQDQRGYRCTFRYPPALMPYIAEKGSVTLDGISLTVNTVNDQLPAFDVMIIPHTWNNTTLQHRAVGDHLNLEIDVLARYAARFLSTR